MRPTRCTDARRGGHARTPGRGRAAAALAIAAGALLAGPAAAADAAWTPMPDPIEARQEVAGALVDGALYVVGGFGAQGRTLASAERLAGGADAWEALPPMPAATNHPAAAAVDGRLYVFGGFGGPGLQNPLDRVQVFDPATGAWTEGTPMPTARGGLAAAVVDGRVYVLGGARGGVPVPDAAVFDPAAESPATAWTELPDMPTGRDHLGAAAVDGRIHAIGGRAAGELTLDVHEVFDPVTGTWSTAAPMPTGRSGHAVAALGGCVYALGGEGNPADPFGMFAQVERYDVARGAWEALPDMPLPRHGMGAVPHEGRLLVPAGATVAGFGAVRSADAYRPPACGG